MASDTKNDTDSKVNESATDSKMAEVDMSGLEAISAGLPKLPEWMLSATAELTLPTSGAGATSSPATSACSSSVSSLHAPVHGGGGSSGSTLARRPDDIGDNDDENAPPIAGRCDDDPRAAAIRKGFRINEFLMRDGVTGKVLWRAVNLDEGTLFNEEVEAHLPAATLKCKAVTRQINFTSIESMRDFFMVQRVWLGDTVVEMHEFSFGFVIPRSTNTWEQVIEADEGGVLPAEVLSGNLLVETRFYDKSTLISTAVIRVYYD